MKRSSAQDSVISYICTSFIYDDTAKIATIADISTLKGCVSKDEHLLHDADVNLYDKMNYDACHRLTRPELDKLLEKHVQGAQSLL